MKLPGSKKHPVHKVQLIFPPMVFSKFQSRQTAMYPLGLGYIAAVLERDGYKVGMVDCPSEGFETLVDIGKNRYIYGLTENEIRERIERMRPEAVGISCLFSTLEKQMSMVARIAKEVDPNIIVICGGPHVSAFYNRVINNPNIDYCIVGEGEEKIIDLLEALNNKRPFTTLDSICYRSNDEIIYQPRTSWIKDLDQIPYPARHLLDLEHYFKIGKVQGLRLEGESSPRIAQMTTSRGCPFTCNYCAKDATWGSKFRTRSPNNVLDEMEHLIREYGIEHFAFQDDNLTADMKRAAKIFDGITERNFNITWEAHNGLGVNYLNRELLEKMKASGCTSFTIAVESANDAILASANKPNFIKKAPSIVAIAKELGIEVRGFFMIGFPGETLEEVWNTVKYARSLQLAVSAFALVTPLPGTLLYQQCIDNGIISEQELDFEDLSFGAIDFPLSKVPVEQLKAIRKIEWLRTVMMDEYGNFNHEINMKQEEIMEELNNGLLLFPDNSEIQQLYQQAQKHYAHAK